MGKETREAVAATHGMARNALQRHYRFLSSLVGKEDVAAIRAALTGELQPHVKDVADQHEAEQWRDRLLSADERQLAAFVAVGIYIALLPFLGFRIAFNLGVVTPMIEIHHAEV